MYLDVLWQNMCDGSSTVCVVWLQAHKTRRSVYSSTRIWYIIQYVGYDYYSGVPFTSDLSETLRLVGEKHTVHLKPKFQTKEYRQSQSRKMTKSNNFKEVCAKSDFFSYSRLYLESSLLFHALR